MKTKSLNLEHPIFAIAANMSAEFMGSMIYPRINTSIFREVIINFIFDEEYEVGEDE